MLRNLLQRRGSRYLFIGGSVYVFEMIIIVVAQNFGADAVTAVAISFWIGIVTSFLLQKFITFDDNRVHGKVLVPQIIAFALLVLFNFCITLLVTNTFAQSFPTVVTRTAVLAMTSVWNFYLYKTRVFKTDQSPLY